MLPCCDVSCCPHAENSCWLRGRGRRGLQARFIGSPEELRGLEPDLRLPGTGGAALLAPGDWQIVGVGLGWLV